MALFQPSNITPSSWAGIGGGTVAVADNVRVSWQLNGNSAMMSFSIEISDTANTLLHTINYALPKPFYPTDNKGNPQFYTYFPDNTTWASLGLSDGNTYKLKITQNWSGGSVTQFSESQFITRTAPILEIQLNNQNISNTTAIIQSVSQLFTAVYQQAQGDTVAFVRWQLKTAQGELVDDTGNVDTQLLSYTADSMRNGNTYVLSCLVQTQNGVNISATANIKIFYYIPTDIDGKLVLDTSDKYANTLLWENYQIAESISGVATGTPDYKDGVMTLPESATVVWNNSVIGGVESPLAIPADMTNGWTLAWKGTIGKSLHMIDSKFVRASAFSPDGNTLIVVGGTIETGFVHQYSVNGTNVIFEKDLSREGFNYVEGAIFSPDGKILIIYGGEIFNGFVSQYTVENSLITYVGEISVNGSNLKLYDATFSPDGKTLILLAGSAFQFSVNSSAISYVGKVALNTAHSFTFFTVAFSPDGGTIVFGGSWERTMLGTTKSTPCCVFDTTESLPNLPTPSIISLSSSFGYVETATFSPDGKLFIAGGASTPTTAFSIEGDDFSLIGKVVNGVGDDIEKLSSAAFSPDGKVMFLGAVDIYGNATTSSIFTVIDSQFAEKYNVGALPARTAAFSPNGNILVIGGDNGEYSFTANDEFLKINSNVISKNFSNLISMSVYNSVLTLDKNKVRYLYGGSTIENALTYAQEQISSITLQGAQQCDWLFVQEGTNESIGENFEPSWGLPGITTVFLADFDNSANYLEAGNFLSTELSTDVYREQGQDYGLQTSEGYDVITADGFPVEVFEMSGNLLKVYSSPYQINGFDIGGIKDFSWLTKEKYQYNAYTKKTTDDLTQYLNPRDTDVVCKNQNFYLLLEGQQDSEQFNVYHIVKYWRFGNNIISNAVGNNNTPSWQQNFTGYRLRQPSIRKGKTGQLQALLSNVVNSKYIDTVKEQEELYQASLSENTFFIKDMKGNLYMVGISAPITQTINTKSALQEVTVTIPWEEVGTAENVSLIQVLDKKGNVLTPILE